MAKGYPSAQYNKLLLNAELASRVASSWIPAPVDKKPLLTKREDWSGQLVHRVYDPLGLSNNLRLTGNDGDRTLDISRYQTTDWISAELIKGFGVTPAIESTLGIGHVKLFSDAPVNYQSVSMRMKRPYQIENSSKPIIFFGWSTPDNNGLVCRWEVAYLWRKINEDMNAAAEDTLTVNAIDTIIVNGLNLTEIELDFIDDDDICVTIKLSRRSDDVADTLNGITVALHGACLSYSCDKLGTILL